MTRKKERKEKSFSLGQAAPRFLWGTKDVPAERSDLESLLWHEGDHSRNTPVKGTVWLPRRTNVEAVRS